MVDVLSDVSDRQLEEVYVNTDQVPLPAVGSLVGAIVTAIVSPTRFFVQLPMGSDSVLNQSASKGELLSRP